MIGLRLVFYFDSTIEEQKRAEWAAKEKLVQAEGFMIYNVLKHRVVECSNTLEDKELRLPPQIVPQVDKRAVYLSSFFVRGLTYLTAANTACGFSFAINELMPWKMFNGLLFQSKYLQAHSGCAYEELLEGNGGPWMESLKENVNPNSLVPMNATIDRSPLVQPSTCKVHCTLFTHIHVHWLCSVLVCLWLNSRVRKQTLIEIFLTLSQGNSAKCSNF
ncbi:Constitutive coactivator of peroxisome proliferator-activated receptor gamma [Bagarius yarrelli]|uniref:Constitutive coactivator of peroxisome proliferator-activated receptor gamma n=1 Tax=Bagarius yarrelli TaxID=175774 RepID=A0A556TR97_BAGYA|nr:Constitutive coactivator of peroxisome proliferator-activated receptor gamma [Bagarius yarrelli]